MASLEERVAYMEGRMDDHTALMADIRGEMRGLRSEIEHRFERVDQRFDRMDQKIDRHFTWLVGTFLALLLALLGLSLQMSRLQPL